MSSLRRSLAWVLSLPLMLAGVEAGHWLAYRLAYPDPSLRAEELAGSGHGYLHHLPLALAVTGALGLCAFGARVFRPPDARSGRGAVSLLPFVLLSPVAFVLQELVERLAAGTWPLDAVLSPAFLPGLLFQLPFALAAFLIARWLLRTANRLRARLFGGGAARRALAAASLLTAPTAAPDPPRVAPLARGYGKRGPPELTFRRSL